jgi:hypothetical protein
VSTVGRKRTDLTHRAIERRGTWHSLHLACTPAQPIPHPLMRLLTSQTRVSAEPKFGRGRSDDGAAAPSVTRGRSRR